MSAVLRIAWREIRERRFLLVAAATLSLLGWTLIVAHGPAWTRSSGESLAIVLFIALPTSVAIAVGGSLIGRDLAEGKLSFYFSRPLSSGALWAGKFLGGAVLVVGAWLCCSIPFAAINSGYPEGEVVGFWVVLQLGLMAFAHVATSMYRSGRRLFALDLGLGALFMAALSVQVRHLLDAGAGRAVFGSGPAEGAIAVAFPAATIVMLTAAGAQLAHGRVDARRGHVALSATIWGFALLALAVSAFWGRWLLAVTPADVGGVGHPLFAAPGGGALLFKGPLRDGRAGFSPVFLMDGESGSYVRVPHEHMTPPAFAADGSRAVWLATPQWFYPHPPGEVWAAPSAGEPGDTLTIARLDRGAPVIEERPLELSDRATLALAVDGDGRRVLLSGRASVLLLDTASATLLASLPVSDVVAAEFLADGAVRFYQKERPGGGGAALVVLEWRPKDGSRTETARVSGEARLFLLTWHSNLAVVSTGARSKAILDTLTGAVRAFTYTTPDSPGAALVLSNGHVALSLGAELRIVTRDGATVASLPLDAKTQVYALCEPEPGVLGIGLRTLALATRRTVFVDAATGAVRREESEILPAGARDGGRQPPPVPGSLASRLFTDLDGALLALEADGRRRVIVAAP